jgi:ATP-dependent helicase/nuclease subunit A
MESARTQTGSLTPTQQRAVKARGNVLVMAGAGTGKTRTLVERCLYCLEHDGAAMDEMLVVTFTEAAAAEMRERLRRAIEVRAQAESIQRHALAPLMPGEDRWAEQLARFDLAHIGTLHSFCLKLVREHFYELSLDPRLAMLDEGEARQLANETLDEQFAAHYAGGNEFSLAVQNLIQTHGGGRDEQIRKLVLQLHHYSQARPDAAGWLARQREKFSAAEPADWQRWLPAAVENWREEWLPVLENLKGGNEKAAELAAILSRLNKIASRDAWRETAAEMLAQIVAADASWPDRRKTILRKPLEDLFDEAQFFQSLVLVKNGADPLVEDWSWIRGQMETLLRLAEEFALTLAERKQTNGVLDFHDLEQFALKLLWDFSTGQPAPVAANWRAKLKFVFVDEYQDINAAQDKIITGLSRDGAEANRFLVGDVKQSIYRFRLADPKIFRKYAHRWRGQTGETIPLSENFRSREGLLNFVNSLFRLVMREEVGGVAYDADAELKFGPGDQPNDSSGAGDSAPCAELLLRFKNGRNEIREDESSQLAGLDDTQREARLVAWRLQQLVASGHVIFDDDKKVSRPVAWRDIAILLRSPRGRSEIFAKEFERAGIPLAVARGGFYESAEILDLLSLLQLLDNPLQDVPCLAVLRSPLVGLSLDELAEIRLAAKDKHFWTALNRSAERGMRNAETAAKISKFLGRFSHWRKLAKLVSLSQCLEEVLAETFYADWLKAQPRGVQRAANVAGFLHLAQQFDQFQRQGLFRFLKFIAAQQEAEAEPEVPAAATENAVYLMSIHQSKGLEFPVVVLADLAKQFNERDLRGEIIFDEEFGLCPRVKPPHMGGRYPSLPHWLAQRRQKRELRGEELRLFYVALTRARDHLILTASIPEKSWDEAWTKPQPVTARKIAAAKCFADWLALWFSIQVRGQGQSAGTIENFQWQIVADAKAEGPPEENNRDNEAAIGNRQSAIGNPSAPAPVGQELETLRARLEWNYPFKTATQRKAKSSVTALRREAEALDDEAEQVFPERQPAQRLKGERTGLSAPEIGAAHHKFLQLVELDKTDDLAAEADRLARENYLSAEERADLDLAALGAFWNSVLGRKIRAHAADVRRELPFTARFSPLELAGITGVETAAGLENEFVIVQGVADLVVLRPREIWLVDFKTDEVAARDLPGKIKLYAPQLLLYAAALEKIFARKVTLRALHFLAAGRTEEI